MLWNGNKIDPCISVESLNTIGTISLGEMLHLTRRTVCQELEVPAVQPKQALKQTPYTLAL